MQRLENPSGTWCSEKTKPTEIHFQEVVMYSKYSSQRASQLRSIATRLASLGSWTNSSALQLRKMLSESPPGGILSVTGYSECETLNYIVKIKLRNEGLPTQAIRFEIPYEQLIMKKEPFWEKNISQYGNNNMLSDNVATIVPTWYTGTGTISCDNSTTADNTVYTTWDTTYDNVPSYSLSESALCDADELMRTFVNENWYPITVSSGDSYYWYLPPPIPPPYMPKFKCGDHVKTTEIIRECSIESWRFEPCEEYEIVGMDGDYYRMLVRVPHPDSPEDKGRVITGIPSKLDKYLLSFSYPCSPDSDSYFPNLSHV